MSQTLSEPTARQAEALDWITDYLRRNGMPPTIREIGDAMGIASPNGVRNHLNALVRKRLLRRAEPAAGRAYSTRCYLPVAADGACPCCGRPMVRDG